MDANNLCRDTVGVIWIAWIRAHSVSGILLFLFILFIISGAINVLLYVPVMASLQRVVSAEFYGRVMSLFTMISSITSPLSLMFGGILIDYVGISMIYLFSLFFSSFYLFDEGMENIKTTLRWTEGSQSEWIHVIMLIM